MTFEERRLWFDCLKKLPKVICRQKVIGPYIVDFVCESAKLVIEVDGRQHRTEEGKKYDCERDGYLALKGYHVVRYSNGEVRMNFNAVTQDILERLGL